MYFLRGHKFKTLFQGNSPGYVLPLVLGLLVLGSLSIIPFLHQMAAGTRGVSVMRNLNIDGYSSNSGVEHARWRLQFESGFADSINQGSPAYAYSYPINNRSADITINWVSPMPSPTPTPPPGGSQSDRVTVEYTIVPSNFLAGQPVVVTITITITNIGQSKIKFEQIGDLLPPGFIYSTGTASGYTTTEPATQMIAGQQELTWNWGTPHPELESGQSIQQIFQSSATPPEGVLYNDAWCVFVPGSVGTVSASQGTTLVAQYRKYDVMSRLGNVTLKSRLAKNDINVFYLSWQW